jgi:TRAP-type mannitol/chloroaromatic compound transport system substrate-binding protein
LSVSARREFKQVATRRRPDNGAKAAARAAKIRTMREMNMDRRSFITKAGVATGAAAAASTLATPALSQGREKLTMVTSWGRGSAGVFDAALRVQDAVNTMTDGTLEIDIKASGELVGAFEVFDAVSSGQADIYHSAEYYFLGQHPALAFYSSVPFGMTANELNCWWYHMGGDKLHQELSEIFGLKPFFAGNTGSQSGGWYQKEINGPDDFNGLKIRMPGLGGKVLGHLGASVQNIPGPDVYQALSSGAIEATEWIGPWADEKMGLQEIAKILYTAGFHEPGTALAMSVNLERFNKLSAAHQKALETAAGDANVWNLSQYWANNAAALTRLVAGGVQTRAYSPEVWSAVAEGSQKVYDENMGDDLFKKIFESYRESMRTTSGWLSLSDGADSVERNKALGW